MRKQCNELASHCPDLLYSSHSQKANANTHIGFMFLKFTLYHFATDRKENTLLIAKLFHL